jgi:Gpi18-like mannosyltransferase
MSKSKASWANAFRFAAAMWLLSRVVIAVAMVLIAPSLPVPPEGILPTVDWSLFSYSDSPRYETIVTGGYEYESTIKEKYNIAFFPLFPLFTRGVMYLGLPFNVAGTLVNNLAFLAALVVLYRWVEERHGESVARWATAVWAWCPLSLFGSVIYTEGLFMLFSTAALRAFDKQQHAFAALWGALATATRVTGVVLVPTFLIVAWKERRPISAYVAALVAAGGLVLFSLYCALNFGDPLAFVHAQKAWRDTTGLNWKDWRRELITIAIGKTNLEQRAIVDPWHPLLFVLLLGSIYLLWRFRQKLGSVVVISISFALALASWRLGGESLIVVVMVFGGGYLLWRLRNQLRLIEMVYGFCALGLIMFSGSSASAQRYAYAIVSLAIALGLVLERYPRWAYATMVFFSIILVNFAIRFSQHLWVA